MEEDYYEWSQAEITRLEADRAELVAALKAIVITNGGIPEVVAAEDLLARLDSSH